MSHQFIGKWITTAEFASLPPRNVFHRQLEPMELPCEEHRNRHILFRKKFRLDALGEQAMLYISADDYYKLYINGRFISQGPAPSYHFQYNYNTIDISDYLQEGENLIAVHTLYQGLINRVWQSGDNRHGLILDLEMDGKLLLASNETFKTALHTAYEEMGTCGYQTQFLERFDSCAPEIGFETLDFDDSAWESAKINQYSDHSPAEQKSKALVFERIAPAHIERGKNRILYDFGSNYVGYLSARAIGKKGDAVIVRCGQELHEDGSLRYDLRANCRYEEEWLLADGESALDWFDYKAFRYAELIFPEGVEIKEIFLHARHYPFALKAKLRPEFSENEDLKRIWELCVHTQEYGVQEVIQDCMEREKGFYLGDGCYTALTNMILTHDDSMVRKLIDDAFSTDFITDTLVTCMDCSFMQEIAEFPLILVSLVLWHYNLSKDEAYLAENFKKVKKLLEAYRREYEKGGLLRDLDKWCVVEWPKNFRHGYDVEISEGQRCKEAHIAINAYYIAAIRAANAMASILRLPPYREEAPLLSIFHTTFFDEAQGLYRDGENTDHISLVGNSFVFGFGLYEEKAFEETFISLLCRHGIASLSLFCTFPVLQGLSKLDRLDLLRECLLNDGAWKRILREDGTTTFEGWGKDTKWNTSLFHLTMSYAAAFMADTDLKKLFFGT